MSVSGVCFAFRLCTLAPAIGDGGVDSPKVSGIIAPKCAGIGKRPPVTWTDTTPPLLCVAIQWGCWAGCAL